MIPETRINKWKFLNCPFLTSLFLATMHKGLFYQLFMGLKNGTCRSGGSTKKFCRRANNAEGSWKEIMSFLNDVISLFFLTHCVVCHPARCMFFVPCHRFCTKGPFYLLLLIFWVIEVNFVVFKLLVFCFHFLWLLNIISSLGTAFLFNVILFIFTFIFFFALVRRHSFVR